MLSGETGQTHLAVRPALLGLVWLAVFLFLSFQIVKRRRPLPGLTVFLNAAGLAFFLMSLGMAARSAASLARSVSADQALLASLRGEQAAAVSVEPAAGARPDIYYIILDSYERADALQKYYHFDNSAFIAALRERGFYVADASRSNYMTTAYSIPSALNLVYIDWLPADLFTRLTSGLETNYVADFLRAAGYQTVTFESGFPMTDKYPADLTAAPPGEDAAPAVLNSFELLLLRTTALRLLFPAQDAGSEAEDPLEMLGGAIEQDFADRRRRVLFAFDHLADYAPGGQPHFVFAHIIAPHNPYLWGPNGEVIDYNGQSFLLGDKIHAERNIRLYTGQLQYVNRLILAAVDRILAASSTPPIIILQADHGHDTFYEWETSTPEGIDLRSAILNAYYFPDGDYRALYPSISPVNSFRVVLNQYFRTRFPLLPDRSFNHPHPNHVPPGTVPRFIEVP